MGQKKVTKDIEENKMFNIDFDHQATKFRANP